MCWKRETLPRDGRFGSGGASVSRATLVVRFKGLVGAAPSAVGGCLICLVLTTGCGSAVGGFFEQLPPLFTVPLAIDDEPVGTAIIDTGGGYAVMLRDEFGLAVVGTTDVLAFGGQESVDVTEGFAYSAGGFNTTADFAIVGASICDCNALGYHFFRDTGVVLGLDFNAPAALFVASVPRGGATIPFGLPPPALELFQSSFLEVEVSLNGDALRVPGLLDTGAMATVLRRGLMGAAPTADRDRLTVTIAHERLGTVAVSARLFDTPGLPDLILGMDVMRAWGDRWYFSFAPGAGTVTVFLRDSDLADPAESGVAH